ncbi:uncharacterized protein LOC116350970 [Contarinia nasturtii]|uniref:uncharacterized protein LOC116350970 n=1 Tax=Contarinia nasturtii TaxID=265458 RepID=UPI0012D42DE3|nr:uncharacterized protein LOC116350970 [Contarinia nasturtii]
MSTNGETSAAQAKKKRYKYQTKKQQEEEAEDENFNDNGLLAIKMRLTTIVRPEYHDVVIHWIEKKSVMSTKISVLASLLFLDKVKSAQNNRQWDFFTNRMYVNQKQKLVEKNRAEDVIERCFYAVLQKNKENEDMEPHIRHFVEQGLSRDNQFAWPNNNYFGNIICQSYTRQLKTNQTTHAKKRLRNYLQMRAWQFNAVSTGLRFDKKDVDNAIDWAIRRYDAIRDTHQNAPLKRYKRKLLLDMVRAIVEEVGGLANYDNIKQFSKGKYWFKATAMWLVMQSEIDEFHNWAQDNNVTIPKIKNLSVVPLPDYQRKAVFMCNDVFYRMLAEEKLLPKVEGKQVTETFIRENKEHFWNQIFDFDKINRILKKNKEFHYTIVSNGESVSVLYKLSKQHLQRLLDDDIVRKRYLDGTFVYELGIDPGMKTWNATVRRTISTRKEVNLKTSSKKYHWLTKYKMRDKKAKRWTKQFTLDEQNDRNNRQLYQRMPSPLGTLWTDYICHRIKMLKKGMDVYTTPKYARLKFDKYVESNSTIDKLCGTLVNHQAALIHLGNADMSPNSPIRIKKHVRCPGTRKLLKGFRKRGNCVVRKVDEYFTSQTCAKCGGRFDPNTKSNRFKVCENCAPVPNSIMANFLPSKIVAQLSKRRLKYNKVYIEESLAVFLARGEMTEHDFDIIADRLLSKVAVYPKKWQVNAVSGVLEYADVKVDQQPHAVDDENAAGIDGEVAQQPCAVDDECMTEIDDKQQPMIVHQTTWDRDIVAAKCILIKGHCNLFGLDIPETLQRPRRQQAVQNNQQP